MISGLPDPSRDDLEILRLLDDWDKHRLLRRCPLPSTSRIEFDVDPPLTGPPNHLHVFEGPFEDGDEVYHGYFAKTNTKLQAKMNLLVQVRIRESPWDEEVRETLPKIGNLIQRIGDVVKAKADNARSGAVSVA